MYFEKSTSDETIVSYLNLIIVLYCGGIDSTKAQYSPLLDDDNKYTTIDIIGGGR